MPLPGRTGLPRPGRVARLPLSARLSLSAVELVTQARRTLAEAAEQACPADRYAAAHLAALRGAAAMLAARAHPADAPVRRRPTSAWVLLTSIAPELGEWAAFFAAGSRKRAAAEAGSPYAVSPRDADDLVRDVGTFLAVVETSLGVIRSPVAVASAG
ncbi:MAG TPA: SAV_6107 family HEPN domain-containing protein [Mycobacteriales bacterium]|nr:SAV_6107 family HEPN domain-containing protein [Mycobacteriales bacterium]